MRKKSSPSSYGNRSEGRKSDSEGGKRRSFDNDRPSRTGSDRPKRSFDKKEDSDRPKRSFEKKEGFKRDFDNDRPKRSFSGEDKPKRFNRESIDGDRPKRSFEKKEGFKKDFNREDRPKRPFSGEDKPKRFNKEGFENDRPKRSYEKKEGFKKDFDREDRPKRSFKEDGDRPKRSFGKKSDDKVEKGEKAKRFSEEGFKKPKKEQQERGADAPAPSYSTPHKYKKGDSKDSKPAPKPMPEFSAKGKPVRKRKTWDDDEDDDDMDEVDNQPMPLNKYIAHSGECSRRDAADLIKQGKVKVNGELVTNPGYRVQELDLVTLLGKKLKPQVTKVYILLNKPKGFITTTEDPQERQTVMDLVDNAGVERLFPVGRLDRNTTGLLLLTNDGDVAQKLSHPSYSIKKVYQVTLDKPLTKADFQTISEGVMLEDGMAQVDEIAYLDDKKEIGLEIHSGRNRIVRRIFESLGYNVDKLDRVMYAGLTKKNLPRGKWRFLSEKEVILLKHFKS